jgi:hypothetical protein
MSVFILGVLGTVSVVEMQVYQKEISETQPQLSVMADNCVTICSASGQLLRGSFVAFMVH